MQQRGGTIPFCPLEQQFSARNIMWNIQQSVPVPFLFSNPAGWLEKHTLKQIKCFSLQLVITRAILINAVELAVDPILQSV